MSGEVTRTPDLILTETEKITNPKLNRLGSGAYKIGAGAVSATELATDAVTTVKILAANVTAAKMATDSVLTVNILDANVTADKLATDSVTTVKILAANITEAKLADGAVTLSKIGAGAVGTGQIIEDSIGAVQLDDVHAIVIATAAAFADIAAVPNVSDKAQGKMGFDTTNNRPIWASGTATNAIWYGAAGSAAYTPV